LSPRLLNKCSRKRLSIVSKNNPKTIILFGPTAVGKTRLIHDFFSRRSEVINADSMQVYRGMDIGTAKPPSSILEAVPHHLLDILTPDEQFDVGFFVRSADRLIPEIRERGNIPVLSGGTAYYLKHFIYGLPRAPKADQAARNALKRELETLGSAEMFNRLLRVDPVSASRIAPEDTYRVLRALEVFEVSGKPLSSYTCSTDPRPGLNLLTLGLYRDRQDLNRRIDERVEKMFEEGLAEEVKRLMAEGYGKDAPGMKGIGYREFHIMKEAGCMTLNDVKELIKRNSRRYAKRQMTFFRSLPGVRWVNPDDSAFFRSL